MTLAFFLSWQGVVLIIAKEGGTIAVTNDWIVAIANKNLSPAAGLGAVGDRRRRLRPDQPR